MAGGSSQLEIKTGGGGGRDDCAKCKRDGIEERNREREKGGRERGWRKGVQN